MLGSSRWIRYTTALKCKSYAGKNKEYKTCKAADKEMHKY